MGGGLFALGAWPAGGVVPDASQAEDLKDGGGDTPPPAQQLAASALVVVYIFREPLSGFE